METRMRKIRSRQERKKGGASDTLASSWLESDGLRTLIPAADPSLEALKEASRIYQKNIRNSALRDEMLRQFGETEAGRLLLDFRVESR